MQMKGMKAGPQQWWFLLRIFFAIASVVVLADEAQAQTNTSGPITDPDEARAINTIFSRWRITANDGWNISGNLCSGVAVDSTPLDYNPGIKCNCSYNDNTVCHITSLRVNAMIDSSPRSYVVGPLPDELWSLTYLTNLNLGQNYLWGRLPPSVGNLTQMQYLSVAVNALSGELPTELGKLTDLRSLSIGTNNFSGSLPSVLGNCTMLEELRIDSSGISGEIPPTFAALRKMQRMYARDNALAGRIPGFIGSWSKLISLRIEGTSLQGPIPSTFSSLTALAELRISDLSNGSSSLDFLRNLTSLTILILRNNSISGPIPSSLHALQDMTLLDLSFNSFSGQIPDYIFNLRSIVHLFLGNNSLTGSLPKQKTSVLKFIDLSYNQLSGSFPSWATESNLQLNLVANNFNFTHEGSDSSVIITLGSALNCLQQSFPCNRRNPHYSSFAINCGGERVNSSAGTVFEADSQTLGPAAYYVTRQQRWAVSDVGYPVDTSTPIYKIDYIEHNVSNTRDPEMFQTARLSAGSLRYYGLGLKNGGYDLSLYFVEGQIQNYPNLKSLERRVFDIYIQGKLVWKDFDIRKEAGDLSYSAVVKNFTAKVTQNYLEIHLVWVGKGTYSVLYQGVYGPSISAISAKLGDGIPNVTNRPPDEPGYSENRAEIITGVVFAVGVVFFILLFAIFLVLRTRRQKRHVHEEFLGIETGPYTFTYAELKTATDDFSEANKIGEGGFGAVYKGKLDDERIVAVKQLSVASHQGKREFEAEIATISAVQHGNLVTLYGCCIEGGQLLLVYEYLENKSLDQALFGNKNLYLDWLMRFNICMGVARGLAYLHEESRLRIVHRDVKASNILLDSELNPKISDFGLAKLYDDTKTHISTRIAGTFGYLAPEYAMRGHLTEKADVFSFGVLALEIVSGRSNFDSSLEGSKRYLLEWAWDCHEHEQEMELVHKDLPEYDKNEARRVIGVALLCTQTSPSARPSMSRVVAMLSGDAEIPTATSKPAYLTEWNFSNMNSFVDSDNLITQAGETSSCTTRPTSQGYSPVHATKPAYLTEWNFSDMNSFVDSDNLIIQAGETSSCTTRPTSQGYSPVHAPKPMLRMTN